MGEGFTPISSGVVLSGWLHVFCGPIFFPALFLFLDNLVPQRHRHGLFSRIDLQLRVGVFQMPPHRVHRDEALGSDALVGQNPQLEAGVTKFLELLKTQEAKLLSLSENG